MKGIHIIIGTLIIMLGIFTLSIVVEDSFFQTSVLKMFGFGIVGLGFFYLVKRAK